MLPASGTPTGALLEELSCVVPEAGSSTFAAAGSSCANNASNRARHSVLCTLPCPKNAGQPLVPPSLIWRSNVMYLHAQYLYVSGVLHSATPNPNTSKCGVEEVGTMTVNRTPSHSACADAHIVSAHHIAFIPCTTSVAQGNLDCVPSVCSFHLSCAMSHAVHSTLGTPSSTSPTIIGLQRFITSTNPCADSRELRGDGFTDLEPRTSCEPRRIVNNKQEIAHSTEESLITDIEDKGLICDQFSLPHNRCRLRLKILLKILLRLKKQTLTTNKFVLCWLHHGTYWSEK